MIPIITPGLKPVRLFDLLFSGPTESDSGFDPIVFGMAASAGVEDGVKAAGEEGIGHGFRVGAPHKPGFPENEIDFWLKKTGESGIEPVRLLKEKSTVAFLGKPSPTS
ncbi:hypothetical protein N665_0810s0001 [Sinapis alba]|nr:hypothetical protein N665_0810s0001 [Sinapis alba]